MPHPTSHHRKPEKKSDHEEHHHDHLPRLRSRRPLRSHNLNQLAGLPPVKRQTMLYCTQKSIGLTGAFVETYFRANGPWDPDASAGGYSPLAYPFWEQYYGHQVTFKSMIRVHLVRSNRDVAYGVYLADDANIPYTGLAEFVEAGRGSWNIHKENAVTQNTCFSMFDAKKFFNCANPRDRMDSIGSKTSGTPSEEATFVFWLAAIDQSVSALKVDIVVEIDYDIQFSEPADLPAHSSFERHRRNDEDVDEESVLVPRPLPPSRSSSSLVERRRAGESRQ